MARRDDVERLQGEVEELFDELWQVPSFAGLRRGYRPQADCYRTDDPPELTVVIELPGVAPEDIEILVRGQELVIEGIRRRVSEEGRTYSRVEIVHGEFQRRIALGADIDTASARTNFERGILTVVLPIVKRKPARTAKVSIQVRKIS